MEQRMRLYKYDLVRAVSIAFVVAVHCHNYIDTSIPVLALVDRAIVTLFLVGNALFFMMSGRFNIKKREGDHAVAKYYLGKVRNILIPVVLFFFIRTVFNDWGNLSFTTVIKTLLRIRRLPFITPSIGLSTTLSAFFSLPPCSLRWFSI